MVAGRPRKPVNWDEVELATMAGDKLCEIAATQGLTYESLGYRFEEKYGEKFSIYAARLHKKGNMLLKTAQFKKALDSNSKGNTQMLMFLGKVRLNQRETDGNEVINLAELKEFLNGKETLQE